MFSLKLTGYPISHRNNVKDHLFQIQAHSAWID